MCNVHETFLHQIFRRLTIFSFTSSHLSYTEFYSICIAKSLSMFSLSASMSLPLFVSSFSIPYSCHSLSFFFRSLCLCLSLFSHPSHLSQSTSVCGSVSDIFLSSFSLPVSVSYSLIFSISSCLILLSAYIITQISEFSLRFHLCHQDNAFVVIIPRTPRLCQLPRNFSHFLCNLNNHN